MASQILLLCLFLSPVFSWWSTGHMLVAQVAKLNINQTTLDKVQIMLDYMPEFVISNNLVTSAVWADDLKAMGILSFNNWHFIDNPWSNFSNYSIPRETYDYPDTIITETRNALKGLRSETRSGYTSSMLLKFLVHFVGDAHQPLHACSFFDETLFPKGDLGGNLFKVNFDGNMINLHTFWDSGAWLYSTDYVRPLNGTGTELLAAEGRRLMELFPRNDFGTLATDENPEIWTNESYKIAVQYVYTNGSLTNGSTLSAEYVNQARAVIQRQIALAGYRLAHLLESIPATEPPPNNRFVWISAIIIVSGAFITTGVFYFLFRLKYQPISPPIEVQRLIV